MTRIYVGNLDPRVNERDLEDAFRDFGVIERYHGFEHSPFISFALKIFGNVTNYYLLLFTLKVCLLIMQFLCSFVLLNTSLIPSFIMLFTLSLKWYSTIEYHINQHHLVR